MCAIASQITSLSIVYSTVYSDANQRTHQSSASLAFVRGIHRGPVNSPHKWPVTRKMFPFDDVIILPVKGAERMGPMNSLTWQSTVVMQSRARMDKAMTNFMLAAPMKKQRKGLYLDLRIEDVAVWWFKSVRMTHLDVFAGIWIERLKYVPWNPPQCYKHNTVNSFNFLKWHIENNITTLFSHKMFLNYHQHPLVFCAMRCYC